MARSLFGGRVGDTVASLYNLGNRQVLTLPVDANGDPSSVTLQVWDAPDGTQLTDLLAADGTTPITVVTVPASGQVPEFYGPDGVNVAVYVKDPDDDFYRLDARADDAAQVAADAAAAAEAAQAAAEAVGNTNDTIIAGRINDPASATSSALSASTDARVNTLVPAASEAAAGKIELATAAEATSGTDTARAVTPAGVREAAVSRTSRVKHAPALGIFFPEAEGAVGDGVTGDSAGIQAAITAARAVQGGRVMLNSTAGYVIDSPVTIPSRVRLIGNSQSGNIKIKAAAGLNKSMFRVGATDGTDPNWHWASIENLFFDGNKANQVRPTAVAVTAATADGYVATITTGAVHGLSTGDFTEITGVTPDAYNGRWRVESTPTATTFTIQILTPSPAAGSAFGQSQELVCILAVGKGGETSTIRNCYLEGALNSNIIQGTTGVPLHYDQVSSFHAGEYGFDLWCDRPILMTQPSGDYNGSGLVRCAGKSSAGGTGTDSAITMVGLKAESHTVPAVVLDDFDGAVVMLGGSIDQHPSSTAPCIRRTSTSFNSTLSVLGTRFLPRVTGTSIFHDLSVAAHSVTTTVTGGETYTFHISRRSQAAVRYSQRRNDLTDGVTVTPNLENGTICKLTAGGSRTIAAPTNPPISTPNAQVLVMDIKNNTAGAITTTWNAAYVMSGWTDPAAGKRKTVQFWYDAATGQWVQIGNPSPDLT